MFTNAETEAMPRPSGETSLHKLFKTIELGKTDDWEAVEDPTPIDGFASAEISARLRAAGLDLEELERQRLERLRKIEAHDKRAAPVKRPKREE